MQDVIIITADGRTFRYPAITTGPDLLVVLGLPSVTVGKITPLRNGGTHRCCRFVGPQTNHIDLSEYQEIFLATRQWFGRIELVQEVIYAHQ